MSTDHGLTQRADGPAPRAAEPTPSSPCHSAATAEASATADSVVTNPWRRLNSFTPARIGLGRAGISLPTAAQLDFQLAHAQARDAVHRPLEVQALCSDIEALGLQTAALHSAAESRAIYLQRSDLGRRLDEASQARLQALAAPGGPGDPARPPMLAFAVVDGLSALAVQRHAAPLLAEVLGLLGGLPSATDTAWTVAPVAVVEQGRVAIGDGIGELLNAAIVVVLIGERPGLSSPDSLGLYLTWAPRVGRSDAERNCISNVRPEGLSYREAAARLVYLLTGARVRQLSGVSLKDESGAAGETSLSARPNFLLGER